MIELAPGGAWHGSFYTTELPLDLPTERSRHEFVGTFVRLDGAVYRVRGVELSMHMPPWSKREICSMYLEPVSHSSPTGLK